MNLRSMKPTAFACGMVVFLLTTVARADQPAATLKVMGDVTTPATWDVAGIESTFKSQMRPVNYTVKGDDHVSNCVPLLAVVEAADPAINPAIKNHQFQFIIEVQGFDGYTVDFTLGDLLPDFGNHAVWLALDEDGKPLTEGEGSGMRLILPFEKRAGRWVYGIARIIIVDGTKWQSKS